MKRLFTTFVMLTALVIASAAPVTPDQALGRIRSGAPARAKKIAGSGMALTGTLNTPTTGEAAVYVFTSTSGTVIAPADDAAPALLGYTTEPCNGELPPNMVSWLQCYADQVEYMRAEGSEPARVAPVNRPVRTPIAPLVTTRWNQGAPYYNMCPIDPSTNRRTVTGCVATGMAQVVRWHEWPVQGTGSNSYTSDCGTMSFDYESTTFDYANMVDSYNVTTTQTQRDAVATLMYACGVGVNMRYGSGSSGARNKDIPVALYQYFNYDEHINLAERTYYSTLEWEDLVYDQLEKIGPVIYGGSSTGGSHVFVCDGYSTNGFFHINWGWGGVSDGYFLLTLLNPNEQGVGGGSNSGFAYNACIVADMSKDYGHGTKGSAWRGTNKVTVTPESADLGTEQTMKFRVMNMCMKTMAPTVGAAVMNEDGTFDVLAQRTLTTSLATTRECATSVTVTIPATMAPGTYTVVPVVLEEDGTWRKLAVDQTKYSAFSMVIANGIATFTPMAPTFPAKNPELQSVEFVGGGKAFSKVTARVTISNPYEAPWDLPLYFGLYYPEESENTDIVWTSPVMDEWFQGGETRTLEYELDFSGVAPGEYRFAGLTYNLKCLAPGIYSRLGDYVTINLASPSSGDDDDPDPGTGDDPAVGDYDVYFRNTDSWSEVNVYFWGGNSECNFGGNEMTVVDSANGIYGYNFDNGKEPTGLYFCHYDEQGMFVKTNDYVYVQGHIYTPSLAENSEGEAYSSDPTPDPIPDPDPDPDPEPDPEPVTYIYTLHTTSDTSPLATLTLNNGVYSATSITSIPSGFYIKQTGSDASVTYYGSNGANIASGTPYAPETYTSTAIASNKIEFANSPWTSASVSFDPSTTRITVVGTETSPAETDTETYTLYANGTTYNLVNNGYEYVSPTIDLLESGFYIKKVGTDSSVTYYGSNGYVIIKGMGYAAYTYGASEIESNKIYSNYPFWSSATVSINPISSRITLSGTAQSEVERTDLEFDAGFDTSSRKYTVRFQVSDDAEVYYCTATMVNGSESELTSSVEDPKTCASPLAGSSSTLLEFENSFVIKAYAKQSGKQASEVKTLYVPQTVVTGVSQLEQESGNVEYYRLDGTRISAEKIAPGLYLRREGSSVTKVLVK